MTAASRVDTAAIEVAHVLFPIAAVALAAVVAFLGAGEGATSGVTALLFAAAGIVLFGTVFAAVHHAETIAHVVGEPFGTLIVTIAVTVIEVSLIASMTLDGRGDAALARDTVFSVIMIVCNGLVGLCLLLGGLRYREQEFSEQGATAYLSVLVVLAGITLVLPNYTKTTPGPTFSSGQLAVVSVLTVALYLVFLFIQTVHHRNYFVHDGATHPAPGGAADKGSRRAIIAAAVWLVLALVGVISLAKKLAAVAATGLATLGAPAGVAGVILATLVLLPEVGIAVGAARRNELQRSINAALGSSLATIGLTIPAVAAVALVLHQPLVLGLEPKDMVLLLLTFAVSVLSFGMGRTNVLMGFVHLVMFAAFLLFTLVP